MKVTHKYSIYLDRRQSDIYIDVMQGDAYTRELEFSLYSGGLAWPVPATASVAVAYSGTGGKGIYDTLPDGTGACAVSENVITVTLVPQIMSVPGRTTVTLLFLDENGKQLATFCIIVRVAKNPGCENSNPGDYVNILKWTQAAMATLASELQAELDQHAENLSQSFCYVAEDDGDGNVTLKPFHLGGFTDETLSKPGMPADAARVGAELGDLARGLENAAPVGYGLGGTFSRVYTREEADELSVTGWYLVDVEADGAGTLFGNEHEYGMAIVRVEALPANLGSIRQTWICNGSRYEREKNTYGDWSRFYCPNPRNNMNVPYATTEHLRAARVYSVLVSAGTVKAGEAADVSLSIGPDDYSIIGITRYARAADGRKWYFGNLSGVEEYAYKSALTEDTDGDGEADSDAGFDYAVHVENKTDQDLMLQYMVKYVEAYTWE